MNLEATRGRLRLGSALIMLAFVVCHLSRARIPADLVRCRRRRAQPADGAVAHEHRPRAARGRGARSITPTRCGRSSCGARCSLSRWEWWQLGARPVHSGAAGPPRHRGARSRSASTGFDGTYDSVLALQWLVMPWLAVRAGRGRHRRVGARDDRPAFLAAHQALLSAMARRACDRRPAAADARAQRLRCRRATRSCAPQRAHVPTQHDRRDDRGRPTASRRSAGRCISRSCCCRSRRAACAASSSGATVRRCSRMRAGAPLR